VHAENFYDFVWFEERCYHLTCDELRKFVKHNFTKFKKALDGYQKLV
jgi:hypothetical protein